MNKKKKQLERYQLEKFVSNESLKFRVHEIRDFETPDFIVDINNRKISIEHTRLINPQLQEIETYRNKIIKTAQKKFEEKYSDKLYVLITFKNIELKGGIKEQNNYTNEVFNLIERIYLDNKEYDFRITSKRDIAKVCPTIESFSVNNTETFSHWQHFGAYRVDWIDMKWLQSIITKKEQNIVKYSGNFDGHWLLLVSDFGTKASANRTDLIDFSIIKSKFDKIYIHNYRADEVTLIK